MRVDGQNHNYVFGIKLVTGDFNSKVKLCYRKSFENNEQISLKNLV